MGKCGKNTFETGRVMQMTPYGGVLDELERRITFIRERYELWRLFVVLHTRTSLVQSVFGCGARIRSLLPENT